MPQAPETEDMKISICPSLNSVLAGGRDIREVNVEALISLLISGDLPECYELIKWGTLIKPYFDLDIKAPQCENWDSINKEEVLEQHLEWLRGHFNDPTFAISSCHRQGKISYHIIITNYQTDMGSLRNLSEEFPTRWLDGAVYNRGAEAEPRKFRTILSIKGDMPEKLMPETMSEREQLYHHFIGNPPDNALPWSYAPRVPPTPPTTEDEDETTPRGLKNGIGKIMKYDSHLPYHDWFKIGVSLLVTYGEEAGEKEFRDYSKRNPTQYNEKEFNKVWTQIKARKYKRGGWGLIKKWTPPSYHAEFIKDWELPTDANDVDIADFITKTYNDISICSYKNNVNATGSSKKWYKYEGHRWRESCDVEIKKILIEGHLFPIYTHKIKTLTDLIPLTADAEKKEQLTKKVGTLKRDLRGLKSMRKMGSVCEKLFMNYYDRDFKERLDQDPYLLGFEDGVLDLTTKEFRPGDEHDWISLSTGYKYKRDRDTERETFLMDFINKICCGREDLQETLLKVLARHLVGDNSTRNQLFYCWYGEGANGKSSLGNLLKGALGEYYGILPTSVLTQKSQRADGCNQEIVKIVGRRLILCSEKEKNTEINLQTLKNLTGEAKICYRGIMESMRETRTTFSLALQSNELLALPSEDYGTARRVRYIPFNARFVTDPDFEPPAKGLTFYKKDTKMNAEIKTYGEDFMNILIDHLSMEDIAFPPWMLEETERMLKSQDMLTGIVENTFEYTHDEAYGLSWEEIKKKMRQDPSFRTMKFNSDAALMDAVRQRMRYADRRVSNYVKPYTSTFRGEDEPKKSKHIFHFVKVRVEDEDAEQDCIF
jgi:phage/plasmid-associated DNA primase